jgi:hypothetical protein
MSAVLQTPAIPMPAAIEARFNAMEARIKSLERENMEMKTELLETKELLAISLKRNTQLENAVFKHDSEGEIIRDEDDIPKVSIILSVPIATENHTEEKAPELPIIPTTTLDLKAEAIVTHMQQEIKPNWGKEIVMNTTDIYTFFKEKVTDKLRWKPDLRNPRQAKKEIIERATKMYPDLIEVRKSKGNKVTGIALKTSGLSSHTYACN